MGSEWHHVNSTYIAAGPLNEVDATLSKRPPSGCRTPYYAAPMRIPEDRAQSRRGMST